MKNTSTKCHTGIVEEVSPRPFPLSHFAQTGMCSARNKQHLHLPFCLVICFHFFRSAHCSSTEVYLRRVVSASSSEHPSSPSLKCLTFSSHHPHSEACFARLDQWSGHRWTHAGLVPGKGRRTHHCRREAPVSPPPWTER
jgi:hypothetical protein